MSLFVGKIHYWLYNKIAWFEKIEEDIVRWAKEQGLPADEWLGDIYAAFGEPTGDKALDDVIDTANIHEWLQQRIQGAESRQADLVTRILAAAPGAKDHLVKIYAKQGALAAGAYGERAGTPEGIFNAMNDFLLEGMPCDRVNEIVGNSDLEISWETVLCLHTPYWEEVNGDVQNFYDLREAWVMSFVQEMNPAFEYRKDTRGINKIAKK